MRKPGMARPPRSMQGDLAVLAHKVMPEDIAQGFQNMNEALASIPHGSTAPPGTIAGPGGFYNNGSTAGLLIRQLLGDRHARGLEGPEDAVARLAARGQYDPRVAVNASMLTGMMRK